jgi:4-carboxymuconolactone decarboxylase
MKRIRIRVVIALLVLLTSFSSSVSAQIDLGKREAQTRMNSNQTLDVKEQSIVIISALTAQGDLENLRKALNGGLDSGLTVNEIKEGLVQVKVTAARQKKQ